MTDELLAECGLSRGGARAPSYRCAECAAVLIPTLDVVGPTRRKFYHDDRAKSLRGFRDGDRIPPVEVFHEMQTEPAAYHLLDGMHRWRASQALGFAMLPALLVERDYAGFARGHPAR